MDRTTLSARMAIVVIAITGGANAWSQNTVVQTLDSVLVHSQTDVLEMPFDDPMRSADFFVTGISGANFRACKRTAIAGLFCLDGSIVVRTPNIANPLNTFGIIDCGDPALDLATNKGNPCTAMTVDSASNVFLGTKTKGKTHGLVKAMPNPGGGGCPPGTTPLQGNTYCAEELATGRPLLVDLTSIDGDTGASFVLGPGILGLEERKTAVYFPVGGAPIVIASGKNDWALAGNEQLTSITAVQVNDSGGNPVSHVLATSTNGRVLARRADGSGSATVVFDIPANRPPANGACPVSDSEYGIRSSTKSGLIYVTDRAFCQASALVANADASGQITSLEYAIENVNDDLVLSTGSHAPISPTVAPGISIDLDDCVGSCVLVADAQGAPAATLSNVQLASLESGLTLFQVKNIPDCRWDPATCEALLGVPAGGLIAAGVIADPAEPAGAGKPEAQLLNMTKLLPMEITDLFVMSGGLPDMWLARQYRGQRLNNYTFEAFFGVTEDNVVFRETFEGEFNVQALAGFELGCELGLPAESPLFTVDPGGPNEELGTLEWDVIATVSERFPTLATGIVLPFIATMTNSTCGTSKSIDVRWSLKPYNLEVTPCTYNGNPADVWDSDGSCPLDPLDPEAGADDAVFAKLLLSLFDDFKLALDQTACINIDGNVGGAPLTASRCSALQADWTNAKDKLDKCWSATQQPKQSSGNQNCSAFVSQLNNLRNTLNAATVNGSDVANRVGELKARLRVVTHVHDERFVPSIPAGGFDEPTP